MVIAIIPRTAAAGGYECAGGAGFGDGEEGWRGQLLPVTVQALGFFVRARAFGAVSSAIGRGYDCRGARGLECGVVG